MRVLDQPGAGVRATSGPTVVASVAALVLAIGWILLWYAATTVSIVRIWERSPTFTHGYLVVPVVLWLVWRDRGRLATVPLAPCWAALPLLVLAGAGWFVADQATVLGGKQFLMAAMIPVAVCVIAGTRMLRELAFPLGYLFFGVPFGEFLVAPLMDWTATFTVTALRLSGIPVFREGMDFVVPTGRWSVVAECSGLNYLIASVAVGTLYAYLAFGTLKRRLLFVAFAALVPLLANGVRAYLIVLIAHLSNNRLATGIDHIMLGWVLFGLVMLLMFWSASLWPREHPVSAAPAAGAASPAVPRAPTVRIVAACAAVLACVTPWRLLADAMDERAAMTRGSLAALASSAGWQAEGGPLFDWAPDFVHPTETVRQTFVRDGERVGVVLLLYRDQNRNAPLVTSANEIVAALNPTWRTLRTGKRPIVISGAAFDAGITEFKGPEAVLAWHWYWVDDRFTSNAILGKIYGAIGRLAGRGNDGALVVVYTDRDGSADAAAERLARFVEAMGVQITQALRATQGH